MRARYTRSPGLRWIKSTHACMTFGDLGRCDPTLCARKGLEGVQNTITG